MPKPSAAAGPPVRIAIGAITAMPRRPIPAPTCGGAVPLGPEHRAIDVAAGQKERYQKARPPATSGSRTTLGSGAPPTISAAPANAPAIPQALLQVQLLDPDQLRDHGGHDRAGGDGDRHQAGADMGQHPRRSRPPGSRIPITGGRRRRRRRCCGCGPAARPAARSGAPSTAAAPAACPQRQQQAIAAGIGDELAEHQVDGAVESQQRQQTAAA